MGSMTHTLTVPEYPFGEEVANAVSHGIGLLASLVGIPVLIVVAARHSAAAVIGTAVFGAAIFVLYLSSTLYHSLPQKRCKRVFHAIDHSAIYLLIAGTYTPFTLTVLRGAWGWWLFGVVWGLALLGIALKSTGHLHHPVVSTALYLVMGWLVVAAIKPLWQNLPAAGLAWLVAGGLFYTLGVLFYASKRIPWAHFVWHLFVLGGTGCHYFAVLKAV
jgi:hemolysin III